MGGKAQGGGEIAVAAGGTVLRTGAGVRDCV